MLKLNKIYQGGCLELMKGIPDESIDMILCDLPYGTTKCKWDIIIPFDDLWEQYNRIIKERGAIVLFGSEPFASNLRLSNLKHYKYDWHWIKSKGQGFFNVKKMPLKTIETISVFYKKLPTYNPQGIIEYGKTIVNPQGKLDNANHMSGHNGGNVKTKEYVREFTNYPRQELEFGVVGRPLHNTQKPVDLLEYLIKTYTVEGETVLDNCIGSGSTAIAAINTNRNYIGIELEQEYVDITIKRINEHLINLRT